MKHIGAQIGFSVVVVLFMIFVDAPPLDAQTVGGTISGLIVDSNGAVIPRVEVSIRNLATGVTRTVATSDSGFYSAPNLVPGKYEIAASAPGFSTEVRTNITLTVGAEQVVHLQMRVGAVTERLEISGGAPTVDLVTSTLSHIVEATTIVELPLNGRDWTQLATLQPGVAVVATQQTDDLSRTQRGNGVQMTISGGRPSENNYRLNGVNINDYANTAPGSVLGTNLGVDAIQEFSVLTSSYSAEYGRTSGGVINAVTRSGSNGLHGSAYYFHRNSALDARNFFDQTIPPFRRHQFGGAAGGPIKKDRTFWFADYEGLREFLSVTQLSTVPSAAAREGRLSSGAVTVDPAVKPYLAIFPLPNGRLFGAGDTGEFSFAGGRVSRADFMTGRIDHRFSEKDNLSGIYLFDDGEVSAPDEYNTKAISEESRRHVLSLEETHIFSPQLVNVVRLGVSRTKAASGLSQIIFNPLLEDIGLGFVPGRAVGIITIGGLSGFSGGKDGVEFNLFHYTSYQVYDDVILTKGIHSLKLGANVERLQDNYDAPNVPNGRVQFGSLANFLTNRPGTFDAQFPGSDTVRGMRQTVFGAYVQDDLRLRRNLTLNLGLRYEMATVPTEVNGKLATLIHLTDLQVTVVKSLYDNFTLRNFAPRLGFAWDPFGTGKTSIRGGFGIFDILPLPYTFVNETNRTPPFFSVGVSSNLPAGSFPKGLFSRLGPTTLRTVFIEQNPSRAYKMGWSLTVQRELLSNVTALIGYVGARGVHLPQRSDDLGVALPIITSSGSYFWPSTAPRLNPNFGRIVGKTWNADSYYHALQLGIRKNLSHGLQLQGSYTWAKSIDTSSVTFSTPEYSTSIGNPFPFDPRINRGLSDFDLRHNFVLNFLWQVPTPKSWSGAAGWLLGGWQWGGIYQARSGSPFTALLQADRAGTKQALNRQNLGQRPNLVLSPGCTTLTNPGNPDRFIKTECFTFPAQGTLGSLGRNTLTGPGLSDFGFSVLKNNRISAISENLNVQFRAEFFNLLNHPNFALPDSTNFTIFDTRGAIVGSAGRLTRTQTASRQIQFGIKILW